MILDQQSGLIAIILFSLFLKQGNATKLEKAKGLCHILPQIYQNGMLMNL